MIQKPLMSVNTSSIKKTDPQIRKSPTMDPFLHTRVTQILQFHSRLNPPLVQSTSHPVRGTPMIKSIICWYNLTPPPHLPRPRYSITIPQTCFRHSLQVGHFSWSQLTQVVCVNGFGVPHCSSQQTAPFIPVTNVGEEEQGYPTLMSFLLPSLLVRCLQQIQNSSGRDMLNAVTALNYLVKL